MKYVFIGAFVSVFFVSQLSAQILIDDSGNSVFRNGTTSGWTGTTNLTLSASTLQSSGFRLSYEADSNPRVGRLILDNNWDGVYGDFAISLRNGNDGVTDIHERFRVKYNGSVGIGTSNPNQKLVVKDGNILIDNDVDGAHELIFGNENHGVKREGNIVSLFTAGGTESGISFAQKTWLDGGWNGWDVNMKITNAGNVGIGTVMPDAKLAVNGTIHTKEVKVDLDGWSDFVFDDDYNLRTLEEIETYVDQNKHLPEIPSEAEVLENGIDVGKMNAKLLQKIEELTLYLIDQNKQNQSQQELIEELQIEVSALKSK